MNIEHSDSSGLLCLFLRSVFESGIPIWPETDVKTCPDPAPASTTASLSHRCLAVTVPLTVPCSSLHHRQLAERLTQLKDQIQGALVERVVEDFVDIVTPLKQFSEASLAPEVR